MTTMTSDLVVESPITETDPDGFDDLDITLIEQVDPNLFVTMTDDNCGSTCEKSTCVTFA